MGSDKVQVLNRREGVITKIWNTFYLRNKLGIKTVEEFCSLKWMNVVGKPEDYLFHIAQYPIRLYRAKKKIVLAPIDHYGYLSSEEFY